MSRASLLVFVLAFLLSGCNSSKASLELKVRFARDAEVVTGVTDQGNRFQTGAPQGGRFAVVGATVTFNRCTDSLDPKMAEAMGSAGKGLAAISEADFALVFPDGKRYKTAGAGERDQIKCMDCNLMLAAPCADDKGKSFSPVYVFAVPAGTDTHSATLEYRGAKAPLAGAPAE